MHDMRLLAGRAWRCATASSVIWCAIGRAGAQWELIDPPNAGPISAFGVADGDPDVVYVATNPDGAWQTLDGGATDLRWLFSGMGLYEVHMTAAPIALGNNQYRYTMSIGGGIRRTSNGGQGWSGGTPPGGRVKSVKGMHICSSIEKKSNRLDSCVVRRPGQDGPKPTGIARADVCSVVDEPIHKPQFAVIGSVVESRTSFDERLTILVWAGPFQCD